MPVWATVFLKFAAHKLMKLKLRDGQLREVSLHGIIPAPVDWMVYVSRVNHRT